eukprot:189429-Chlamydomonas_euryale.AAC.4
MSIEAWTTADNRRCCSAQRMHHAHAPSPQEGGDAICGACGAAREQHEAGDLGDLDGRQLFGVARR